MRTRTVAALLGAVVALGMGVDLAGGAGGRYSPALVLTDHTTPACAGPSATTAPPRPACRRSACAKPSPGAGRVERRRHADPAADRRLQRRCRKVRPSPNTTRTPSLVAPSARGGGR